MANDVMTFDGVECIHHSETELNGLNDAAAVVDEKFE